MTGLTDNIALFATVHVPMLHPVFAAKALTTIDHASGGRAGLNIVCGWNPEEFGCFGLEMIEDRYGQGLEWFEILSRIYTEPAPFDFAGRYCNLRGVSFVNYKDELPYSAKRCCRCCARRACGHSRRDCVCF